MKTHDDLTEPNRSAPPPPPPGDRPPGRFAKKFIASPADRPTKANPLGLVAVAAVLGLMYMSGGWALLVVVGALVVSVTLHEFGHYITAKRAGMKVTEFFLGAGPRLWSFRRGETEYGLKAVPVLAYVRIIGMSNLEEVPPEDEARTYRQQPFWRRFSVAFGGPFMNLLIAFMCIWSLIVFNGVHDAGLFNPAPESPEWTVAEVVPDSAAAQAGLQAGDKVVAIGDQRSELYTDVSGYIRAIGGQETVLTVRRDGREITLPATIGVRENGQGLLGIRADPSVAEVDTVNPVAALPRAFGELGTASRLSIIGAAHAFSPSGLANLANNVANAGDTNPGPTVGNGNEQAPPPASDPGSSAPVEDENRLLSIVGAVGIGADFARAGWVPLVFFLALMNVFLALINLVPLLPFDGGHIAVASYEKVRSVLRRGVPYHADVSKLMPLTYGVIALLAFIGLSSIYLDIVNPVSLD